MPYHDIDLHGEMPDRGRVSYLLDEALQAARHQRRGLRIIHGRGEGVMAALVHDILADWAVGYTHGWANPGETRVELRAVLRARGSDDD